MPSRRSSDKVLGVLLVGLSSGPYQLLTGDFAEDAVKLDISLLRVIVVVN